MTFKAIHYEDFIYMIEQLEQEGYDEETIEEIKKIADDLSGEVVDPDNPPGY